MIISPAAKLLGRVVLPGDKSISHRAAMFAAIAEGTTRISNFAASADCASTLSCLAQLGIRIDREGSDVIVHGAGKYGLKKPDGPLDCGNSGTTMRLLAGILAGQDFESTLIGDDSLSKRPMRRIIGPLTEMGAVIGSTDGHAPLVIKGRSPLKCINYTMPVASAQVKSCVLLAGAYGDGGTAVTEPVPTRDHTERMLKGFGVRLRTEETAGGKQVSIHGNAELSASDIAVPADVSSAAFFLAAAACLAGSELELPNVGINPTRTGVIDALRRFGADITILDERVSGGEPVGTLLVRSSQLARQTENNVIKGEIVANLIDEVPILAVFATQAGGGIEIRDAGELRIKESDRIAAVAENLRRMGADVEEFDDGVRVGRSRLKGARIETFGDHRIAMAFAVAGLFAQGETEIPDAECAAVSFPGFFDALRSVIQQHPAAASER